MTGIRILLAFGLIMMAGRTVTAQHATGCTERACCAQQSCCPNCHATCVLEVNQVTVDKECYDVECKPICVPRVRLPWQKCCEPACADVIYVNVLTVRKFECQDCEYKWRVETDPNAGCGCGQDAEVPMVGAKTDLMRLPPLDVRPQHIVPTTFNQSSRNPLTIQQTDNRPRPVPVRIR